MPYNELISRFVYVFIPSLQEAGSFWLHSALFNNGVSDRAEGIIPGAFVDPNLLQAIKRVRVRQIVSDCDACTNRWDGFL